jgi:hypothetical protein
MPLPFFPCHVPSSFPAPTAGEVHAERPQQPLDVAHRALDALVDRRAAAGAVAGRCAAGALGVGAAAVALRLGRGARGAGLVLVNLVLAAAAAAAAAPAAPPAAAAVVGHRHARQQLRQEGAVDRRREAQALRAVRARRGGGARLGVHDGAVAELRRAAHLDVPAGGRFWGLL